MSEQKIQRWRIYRGWDNITTKARVLTYLTDRSVFIHNLLPNLA